MQAEEGYSLDAQMERLRAFCASQGWQIAEIYTDAGESAKNLERPELQRLLQDAQASRFDVLVVYRLDRLSRSVVDLYEILRALDAHGVAFKSATEVFDTTSAMGRLFITIVAALAQWERENLSERILMGQIQMTQEGRWSGGHAAFGYRLVSGRLEIHEPAAIVVREIFRRYCAGAGHRSILAWLNDPENPQPAPVRRWTLNTLKYLLRNPLYAGYVRFGLRSRGIRRTIGLTVAPGLHSPIITQETWELAQATAAERYTRPGRPRDPELVLTGLLRCGLCGSRLQGSVHYKTNRASSVARRYYVCQEKAHSGLCKLPRIQQRVLVDAILDYLRAWYDAGAVPAGGETRESAAAHVRESKRIIENELGDIERRRKRWMDGYEEGDITSTELRERLDALTDQRRRLERQLSALVIEPPSRSDTREALSSLTEDWPRMPPIERNASLRAIIDHIIVLPGPHIQIHFR